MLPTGMGMSVLSNVSCPRNLVASHERRLALPHRPNWRRSEPPVPADATEAAAMAVPIGATP